MTKKVAKSEEKEPNRLVKTRPGPIFEYITKEGLEQLSKWKYVSGPYTPLDNAMQPFWNWFVTLIPIVRKDLHTSKLCFIESQKRVKQVS